MALSDITIPADATNGAGLKSRVYIVAAADDEGVTATGNEITAFATGPVFKQWEFARNTLNLVIEAQGEDDDSTNWNVTLTGFIPKVDKTKSALLTEFANQPLMVVAEDRNGALRKFGAKFDGAKLMFNEEINDTRNGYAVTIMLKGAPEAPYYVDAIATIPIV